MNENQNGSKWVIGIVVVIAILLLGSCGSSADDDYRQTLESGQRKYYSGESMTRDEYNAVKSFNNWKSKQGEKSYSEWDK